ncbi:MAG: hypothetical protein ACREXY_11290 [Gammaproteobacteria bacterium]
MTDFIWGFILGLLAGSFGVFLTLALAYIGERADADDLADWRRLGKEDEDDWVWIG